MDSRRLRLLVPLDGSASAERALHWAVKLAQISHMELILFCVALPPRAAVLLAPRVDQAEDYRSEMLELSDEHLHSLSINLREKGVEASCETRSLVALDEAVAELRAHFAREVGDVSLGRAGEDDVDVVVMASHGMTSKSTLKWGSVTEHAHSHVEKPILMIPTR